MIDMNQKCHQVKPLTAAVEENLTLSQHANKLNANLLGLLVRIERINSSFNAAYYGQEQLVSGAPVIQGDGINALLNAANDKMSAIEDAVSTLETTMEKAVGQ